MSTKTNFKRIALVAVAALGMGVLNSIPAQAVIPAATITLTASATAGTAGIGVTGGSDSTTGASITVSYLAVVANTDSVTLTISPKTKPTSGTFAQGHFTLTDTSASSVAPTIMMESSTNNIMANGFGCGGLPAQTCSSTGGAYQSTVANAGNTESGTAVRLSSPTANRYVTATFKIHMDSGVTRVAGSYVYTISATPFDAVAVGQVSANIKSIDVTINVAQGSTAVSAAYSTATLSTGATFSSVVGAVDSSVAVPSTASTTTRAVIRVRLANSSNSATLADESITVTTNIGSIGLSSGVAIGKNVKLAHTVGSYTDLLITSDGIAGKATITISTPSVTFTSKTVDFHPTTATKFTVVNGTPILKVGSNTMTAAGLGTIWVKATDATGATVRADADAASGVWAYSSDKTIVTDSATSCTYSSTTGYHHCSLTGALSGKSTITVANHATNLNLATVKDATSVVTVNGNSAATAKIEFNKASYTPGEKGYIYISALDSAGVTLAGQTQTGLLGTGGISLAGSFSGTAPTLTATEYVTLVQTAAIDSGCEPSGGRAATCLVFYAPYAGTSMTLTAKGGSNLPTAGQVAITATATVSDSGAAALAAVAALATTVASLKTLITTLTNLVLKIQKKVKA